MRKYRNLARLSPRVVGLCLFLGAVLLAAVILNLPASAEPVEDIDQKPLLEIEAPKPLEPGIGALTQPPCGSLC